MRERKGQGGKGRGKSGGGRRFPPKKNLPFVRPVVRAGDDMFSSCPSVCAIVPTSCSLAEASSAESPSTSSCKLLKLKLMMKFIRQEGSACTKIQYTERTI